MHCLWTEINSSKPTVIALNIIDSSSQVYQMFHMECTFADPVRYVIFCLFIYSFVYLFNYLFVLLCLCLCYVASCDFKSCYINFYLSQMFLLFLFQISQTLHYITAVMVILHLLKELTQFRRQVKP